MAPTTHEIDPSGDVTLNLVASNDEDGSISTTARVSSKCLSLGSPVFAAMLRPDASFLEGSRLEQTGSTEITLVGDNPEAMLIVLRALHYRSREMPDAINEDELYNLALVVNKYDCFQPLFPWIRLWVSPHRTTVTDNLTYPKWLYISWVFEESETFKKVTKKLITETKLDDGEMVTIEGEKLDEGVPDGIIVEGILKEIKEYQDCISNGNRCKISGLDEPQRTNCDALSLGALTRYMLRANLWPNEIRSESTSLLDMIVQARKIEKLGGSLAWSKPPKITRTPWCDSMEQAENGDHRNCGSYSTVIELANSIEKSVQGLALSDFLRTG